MEDLGDPLPSAVSTEARVREEGSGRDEARESQVQRVLLADPGTPFPERAVSHALICRPWSNQGPRLFWFPPRFQFGFLRLDRNPFVWAQMQICPAIRSHEFLARILPTKSSPAGHPAGRSTMAGPGLRPRNVSLDRSPECGAQRGNCLWNYGHWHWQRKGPQYLMRVGGGGGKY